jgi:AhpD family alkylhydroperoxidase
VVNNAGYLLGSCSPVWSAALTCEGIEDARGDRYSRSGKEIDMHDYRIHTLASAPEASRPALERLKQSFGLIPNLAATMAESPTLISGFVGALGNFLGGTFTGGQRQVLLLTNAVANRCAWAVAFHSTAALREGVAAEGVEAIRNERLPEDRALAALSALTRALIEKRGHVDDRELAAFRGAGFGAEQVLEVIAGLALSVMANYAGNITGPEVEAPFQAQIWAQR